MSSKAPRWKVQSAAQMLSGRLLALLDAIHSGQLKRDQLTALHVRQLTALHNPEVDRRVASTWGRFQQSPAEKRALIAKWEKAFNEAPPLGLLGRRRTQTFPAALCTVSCPGSGWQPRWT